MRVVAICIVSCALLLGGVCRSLAAQVPTNAPPQKLTAKGIENFFKVTPKVYSGSAPEDEAGFAELQKLGIKTIISVDGAKPDVEIAKKFGLAYIHLPIGYDGVPTNQAVNLVKAAQLANGPVFVHCHHGLHRGPAGVAVICMALDSWTPAQATNWMKTAGTATNYAGLYKSVAQFKPPSAAVLARAPSTFPEAVTVSKIVDSMVAIDGRLDNLKLVQAAGYKQPPDHPDVTPNHEALLLHELFKELVRSPDTAKRGEDFAKKMTTAEEAVQSLQLVFLSESFTKERADAAFKRVTDSCAACHKAHRN